MILTLEAGSAYMTAINPELAWSHEEHQRADIIDMLKAQLWASGAYGENYETTAAGLE